MVRRYCDPIFKGRHFDQAIIIQCVRRYLTDKLSSRALSAMMFEASVAESSCARVRWPHPFRQRPGVG